MAFLASLREEELRVPAVVVAQVPAPSKKSSSSARAGSGPLPGAVSTGTDTDPGESASTGRCGQKRPHPLPVPGVPSGPDPDLWKRDGGDPSLKLKQLFRLICGEVKELRDRHFPIEEVPVPVAGTAARGTHVGDSDRVGERVGATVEQAVETVSGRASGGGDVGGGEEQVQVQGGDREGAKEAVVGGGVGGGSSSGASGANAKVEGAPAGGSFFFLSGDDIMARLMGGGGPTGGGPGGGAGPSTLPAPGGLLAGEHTTSFDGTMGAGASSENRSSSPAPEDFPAPGGSYSLDDVSPKAKKHVSIAGGRAAKSPSNTKVQTADSGPAGAATASGAATTTSAPACPAGSRRLKISDDEILEKLLDMPLYQFLPWKVQKALKTKDLSLLPANRNFKLVSAPVLLHFCFDFCVEKKTAVVAPSQAEDTIGNALVPPTGVPPTSPLAAALQQAEKQHRSGPANVHVGWRFYYRKYAVTK